MGDENKIPYSYVFNILFGQNSPDSERNRVKNFTKIINKCLKAIRNELNFEIKLTTYVANECLAT